MAAFSEREMCLRIPVIVILGSTGTAKSKLGIEIARRFGGEILSADSMQVYKGLDIVTNKVTAEERRLAPHHLLDIVEPPRRFTVLDFRNMALPIMEKLMQKKKLPVIVGGTNYYIESLLWKVLVDEGATDVKEEVRLPYSEEETGGFTASYSYKKSALYGDCDKDQLLFYEKEKFQCGIDEANVIVSGPHKEFHQDSFLEPELCGTKCEKEAVSSHDRASRLGKCQDSSDSHGLVKSVSTKYSCVLPQQVQISGVSDKKCSGEIKVLECLDSQIKSGGDVSLANKSNVHSARDSSLPRNLFIDESKSSRVSEDLIDAPSDVVDQAVCLDDEGQKKVLEVDSKLVYEQDKKRLQEPESGEKMVYKKLRIDDEDVNLMDEAALENVPSLQLYEKLKSVDPDMAQQLHPNNKRKIIRSLQVYVQTGRTHTAILREQQSAEGGSELGGPLRFPHSCILWLQCEQKVLDERLDARVDTMLEQGLVQELLDFHRRYNEERLATNTQPDYTKGIFQSIGFKEFHEYLMLSEEERNSERGSELFQVGVDALKLITRRYARRQLRWINNRFLRRPSRQVPPVYGLDATDPSQWNELVLAPAVQIVESYMRSEKPIGIEPLPVTERPVKNELKIHHCDICNRTFIGDIQWNDHLRSRKHHKMLKRKQVHTD